MTGRTHELAAISTLTLCLTMLPLRQISLATGMLSIMMCLTGAITPDIDQATASVWHKIPAGSIWGRIVSPLLGSHRMISHSLAGMALFSWLAKILFEYTKTFLIVNYEVLWWTFILGYLSHLIMDSLTKEGVPWFFPIPIRVGFPPIKSFRVTTGSWVENLIVFPALLYLNGYLIYQNYGRFVDFFKNYLVR